MNFKQFFIESKDISSMCEIEDITQEDMYGEDIVRSWKLTRHFNHWQEVTYFISLDKDGYYQMYDEEGNDLLPDKFEKELYVNAIKKWEFKNSLTPNTKETFGDIIDEL
jgi:hypothetical protein